MAGRNLRSHRALTKWVAQGPCLWGQPQRTGQWQSQPSHPSQSPWMSRQAPQTQEEPSHSPDSRLTCCEAALATCLWYISPQPSPPSPSAAGHRGRPRAQNWTKTDGLSAGAPGRPRDSSNHLLGLPGVYLSGGPTLEAAMRF